MLYTFLSLLFERNLKFEIGYKIYWEKWIKALSKTTMMWRQQRHRCWPWWNIQLGQMKLRIRRMLDRWPRFDGILPCPKNVFSSSNSKRTELAESKLITLVNWTKHCPGWKLVSDLSRQATVPMARSMTWPSLLSICFMHILTWFGAAKATPAMKSVSFIFWNYNWMKWKTVLSIIFQQIQNSHGKDVK